MTRRPSVADRARMCDDGSASVLAVGVLLAIALLLAGMLTVGAAAFATHQMRAAADLAALAGAARRQAGAEPARVCVVALEAARANGARDVDCRVDGAVVQVQASRPVDLGGLPGMLVAGATARAGPRPGDLHTTPADYPFPAGSG